MKLFHVLAGVLLLTSPALAQSAALSTPLDTSSIFSRTRGMPLSTSTSQSTASPPRRTTSAPAPLFMGTFQEQDHMVALLEVQTPAGSRILTLHEGDSIPWDQSHVLAITSDHMQLSNGATNSRIIPLGNNLLNQPSEFPAPNPASPSPAAPRQRILSTSRTRTPNLQGATSVTRP